MDPQGASGIIIIIIIIIIIVIIIASTETDKARLTAIRAQHSSDWLFALPISACGRRLGDEAIRVAVGLRLGLNICEPHTCPCGANVNACGLHGLACKRSAGKSTRHQQLNDLIWRALKRADIPSTKEPTELLRATESVLTVLPSFLSRQANA